MSLRWRRTAKLTAVDVRIEGRDDPTIIEATDAIIKVSAACVCGSDMWPYRGADKIERPTPIGHEYVGVDEEIGFFLITLDISIGHCCVVRSGTLVR